LSIPEQGGQTIVVTLVNTLRELSLLVILDNCEHLIDACAHAADSLLRGCPQVQILATSREPLGITGEVSWRLPSLPVPTVDWRLADDAASLAALAQFDAVQLFVQRAQAVDQSFALTPQNASALAQICRRLVLLPRLFGQVMGCDNGVGNRRNGAAQGAG
jgi:predicted ATPase